MRWPHDFCGVVHPDTVGKSSKRQEFIRGDLYFQPFGWNQRWAVTGKNRVTWGYLCQRLIKVIFDIGTSGKASMTKSACRRFSQVSHHKESRGWLLGQGLGFCHRIWRRWAWVLRCALWPFRFFIKVSLKTKKAAWRFERACGTATHTVTCLMDEVFAVVMIYSL